MATFPFARVPARSPARVRPLVGTPAMDTRWSSAEDAAIVMGSFRFGPFELDGGRRLLLRDGVMVPIVPKALELLELLIEERHRTLGKAELLQRLWPDTIVADNNLTVTMSALRKALGESAARPRYLQTLSRRGYRFVEEAADAAEGAGGEALPPSSSSPARLQQVASAPSERGAGSPSRLVGRDVERRHLERCLAEALAGAGRVVFVTGEPGIGKTALCKEFVDAAERAEPSLIVLRGRALEQFGRGEGYLPWLDAWGALLASPAGELARGVLRQVAPTWCREFAALFPEEAARADAGVTRERLLREMGGALAALAARRPLLILLEDLHWADAASCDLLRWVSERGRQHRWLVVGTFRSVEAGLLNAALESLRREALQHDECDELRLAPLAAEQVAACLAAQFCENEFPDELAAVLYRRTEGHPLFLTRLLSYLVQRRDIIRRREGERPGVWALARPLEGLALDVPEDVRAMVRRKLDSLRDPERLALSYASVEGSEFSSRVLAELLGADALALEEQLQPLESRHRLIETIGVERWPDGQLSTRYRFAHALYQNELYAGLVSGRRAALHRRTAELLLEHARGEGPAPERSRLAATLAVHFERGHDVPRALDYLEQAARNAHRLCAYAEEERLYARALELGEQLPEPERARRRAVALSGLVWARFDAGQAERAERTLKELLEHARRERLPEMECEALRCMGALAFGGHVAEGRALAEEQRRVAQAHGLARHELSAEVALIHCCCAEGHFAEALRRSEEAEPRVAAIGDRHVLATHCMNVGWVSYYQSRFAEAEAAYVRGLECWRDISPGMVLRCWWSLGAVRPHLGELSAGLAAFQRAFHDPTQPEHIRRSLERTLDGSGWILREAGDAGAALARHQTHLERAQALGVRALELLCAIELALDHLALGDATHAGAALGRAQALFDAGLLEALPCFVQRTRQRLLAARARHALASGDGAAAAHAARCLLELAAAHPTPEHQLEAHELLGEVALAARDLGSARASVEAALLLLERHPSALLGWRLHGLAARVHAGLGARDRARAAAAEAQARIDRLSADLRAAGLDQAFLDAPPVRALRAACADLERAS